MELFSQLTYGLTELFLKLLSLLENEWTEDSTLMPLKYLKCKFPVCTVKIIFKGFLRNLSCISVKPMKENVFL